MELGTISSCAKKVVNVGVGFDELAAVTRFDGVGFDVVGIDDIEDDNVVVTSTGCDWEASSLISEQLAIYLGDGHEHHVGFVVVRCLFRWYHGIQRG